MNKSLQVALVDSHSKVKEAHLYSELKIMRSNAGWYVGTTFTDSTGFTEPGSRDTDYFSSKEDAEKALKLLNTLTDEQVLEGIFDYKLEDMNLNPRGVGYRLHP
jgi:hypothetical protein